MIYSASRRSDLPAFYPDYIAEKISRSRKLEAIVFWTKDPRNLLSHEKLFESIQRYPTIIQLTVTGLAGSEWEPNVPLIKPLKPAITKLASILPQGAIRWRFDPIIADHTLYKRFSEVHDSFRECKVSLDEVVVSFPDPYSHAVSRMAERGLSFPQLVIKQKVSILEKLHELSGLSVALCCEDELLRARGAVKAHCVDGCLFDRLYGTKLSKIPADSGQRKQCGCCKSIDIGVYQQECFHHCLYCYANRF